MSIYFAAAHLSGILYSYTVFCTELNNLVHVAEACLEILHFIKGLAQAYFAPAHLSGVLDSYTIFCTGLNNLVTCCRSMPGDTAHYQRPCAGVGCQEC